MLFLNIDKPRPEEVKEWMKKNDLSINTAAEVLGLSKRQVSRFISGETTPKRIHALAMQMVWLLNENKKKKIENNINPNTRKKKKILIK